MKKNNLNKTALKSLVKLTDPVGLMVNGFQTLNKDCKVTIYY